MANFRGISLDSKFPSEILVELSIAFLGIVGEVITLFVELEYEAIDVCVVPALQCLAVLGVLSHHVVAVGQYHNVREAVGREII